MFLFIERPDMAHGYSAPNQPLRAVYRTLYKKLNKLCGKKFIYYNIQ